MSLEIRALDCRRDEALRKIYRRLHITFITPIDPEDIHLLATLIDEILDHLDAAAYRFDAFGLERSPERLPEIAGMVDGCIEATVEAVEVLKREGLKKPDELTRRCEEINRREFETENRVREAVRDLFAQERDPIELIKKEPGRSLGSRYLQEIEKVTNGLAHVRGSFRRYAVTDSS